MEPGNGRHAEFFLRQMGLLGQHNQVILLSIATANGAEDGFIPQVFIAVVAGYYHPPLGLQRQLIDRFAVPHHGIQGKIPLYNAAIFHANGNSLLLRHGQQRLDVRRQFHRCAHSISTAAVVGCQICRSSFLPGNAAIACIAAEHRGFSGAHCLQCRPAHANEHIASRNQPCHIRSSAGHYHAGIAQLLIDDRSLVFERLQPFAIAHQ